MEVDFLVSYIVLPDPSNSASLFIVKKDLKTLGIQEIMKYVKNGILYER
jgi:hypothetical protein